MSTSFLIADIGGTNARFALVNERKEFYAVRHYPCAHYKNFSDAIRVYLKEIGETVNRAVVAIAATLTGDFVEMTSLNWSFSIKELQKEMGWAQLDVINDFHAIALSIPHLQMKDVIQLGGEKPQSKRPICIIGPGTGLGAAWLAHDGKKYFPQATEGGHATLPIHTQRDFDVVQKILELNPHYSHVSGERAVCGKGLINIYKALGALDKKQTPFNDASEISKAAVEKTCPVSVEAVHLFCHFLGSMAGNQALMIGAQGGVYLAGGIIPKLGNAFFDSAFRESFEAKGRFKFYLEPIPVYVITNQNLAFLGLAHYFDS